VPVARGLQPYFPPSIVRVTGLKKSPDSNPNSICCGVLAHVMISSAVSQCTQQGKRRRMVMRPEGLLVMQALSRPSGQLSWQSHAGPQNAFQHEKLLLPFKMISRKSPSWPGAVFGGTSSEPLNIHASLARLSLWLPNSSEFPTLLAHLCCSGVHSHHPYHD
jgi:hypothetical protein